MTNDFKPVGFKKVPFIPKTETRIFLGGRPIDQQTEPTNSKSINKQHYQSERVNEINPGYGPCSYYSCPYSTDFNLEIFVEGNRRKWAKSTGVATWLPGSWETGFWTSHYESRWDLWLPNIDYARRVDPLLVNDTVYTVNLWGEHCAEDNKFCNCALEVIRKAVRHHESGEEVKRSITINSDISKWSRFTFKVGAAIGASFINPGAAAIIGAGAWGSSKCFQQACDSDRGKAFWSTVGDMGLSSFSSGIGGKIDNFLGKLTNNSGGFCDWSKVPESKLVENIKKITGPVTEDGIQHVAHQTLGYSYHPECSICNP